MEEMNKINQEDNLALTGGIIILGGFTLGVIIGSITSRTKIKYAYCQGALDIIGKIISK